MDRLTNRLLTEACNDPWDYCGLDSVCRRDCFKPEPCKISKLVHRLAEYEDEQECREKEQAECEYCRNPIETNDYGKSFYKASDDCTGAGTGSSQLAYCKRDNWTMHWEDESGLMFDMQILHCPHCGRDLREG